MQTCRLLPPGAGDGLVVALKPFPAVRMVSGVSWPSGRTAANGERYGIDRGLDVYSVDVTFFGTEAVIQALGVWLAANARGSFRMDQISGYVFPPNVDQSGEVVVAIVKRDMQERVFLSTTATGECELGVTLRAVGPSFVGTGSLAGLVLQDTFSADALTSVETYFTESGSAVTVDLDSDAGVFSAEFEQGATATANALVYITQTARDEAFVFPTLPSVTYPFGVARGGLPKNCKCVGVGVSRVDLSRWRVSLTLAESFT